MFNAHRILSVQAEGFYPLDSDDLGFILLPAGWIRDENHEGMNYLEALAVAVVQDRRSHNPRAAVIQYCYCEGDRLAALLSLVSLLQSYQVPVYYRGNGGINSGIHDVNRVQEPAKVTEPSGDYW